MTTTIDGVQFKITRLPVAHGAASLRWADRIKGGNSRGASAPVENSVPAPGR